MDRIFLLMVFFFFTNLSFSQESKKEKENQKQIAAYIDSLGRSGAFKHDTTGINGEKIDSWAEYPGGRDAWGKYITDNFPNNMLFTAEERGIKRGKYLVWIEFIVNENGVLSDFRPITNFGFGLEEGFIKLVQNSGVWVPAQSNEKKIDSRVKRALPIEFSGD